MWISDLGNGRYRNPILYADYSDPDVIRVGEDFFMVASSFCNAPALPLLHSKDLVNWKVVNYVLDKVPEFRYRNPIHGCGVWAPSIRYYNETFYVCFPMPDEGIYMTTTKDPYGKWSTPVNIRPGAGWIDPCPFWDDDGKAYLVAGVAKSRIGYKSVLHMVEMSPDGMSLIGKEVRIFDGDTNGNVTTEGPKLYKRNGYYYIFAPAGGVKTGWQLVLRSKNIYGPYEHKIVMKQGDSSVNGPHQGAWIDTDTGEDWFIHFQDVYAAGRIVHLQPMRWENDWPIIGISKNGNDYGEPVLEYKKPNVKGTLTNEDIVKDSIKQTVTNETIKKMNNNNETSENLCKNMEQDIRKESENGIIYEPDTTDEFDNKKLGLQWQWNANPNNDWYDLSKKNSHIRLRAISATPLRPVSDYRNLLLQKWPAPEFICKTKISLAGVQEGDMAGIVSLGMEYCAMAFSKKNGKYILNQIIGTQYFDCDVPYAKQDSRTININKNNFLDDEKTVYFKYEVKCIGHTDKKEQELCVKHVPQERITMSVSFDDINYTYSFSIEAKAGRWVGVKNGIFCTHDNTINGGGYIDVDYIRYNK